MIARRIAVAGLIATLACGAQVRAQTAGGRVSLPETIRRGTTTGTLLAGEHTYYGWIAGLRGSTFALRLRTGRSILVDGSEAVASGRFSAPLYASKIVVVQGRLDTLGHLHASSIFKLPGLDASTRLDR